MNPLKQLGVCAQSPRLDYLKRSLIAKGELRALIERDGLKGVTSNPSILERAIGETDEYADALKQFQAQADHSISATYEHLAIADIRGAADVLRPVYENTRGADGFISLECSPYLANDTEGAAAMGGGGASQPDGEGAGDPGRHSCHPPADWSRAGGIERGNCMMIGSPKEAVDRLGPIFSALAPGLGDIPRTPDREKGDSRASAATFTPAPCASASAAHRG